MWVSSILMVERNMKGCGRKEMLMQIYKGSVVANKANKI